MADERIEARLVDLHLEDSSATGRYVERRTAALSLDSVAGEAPVALTPSSATVQATADVQVQGSDIRHFLLQEWPLNG